MLQPWGTPCPPHSPGCTHTTGSNPERDKSSSQPLPGAYRTALQGCSLPLGCTDKLTLARYGASAGSWGCLCAPSTSIQCLLGRGWAIF